MLCCLFVVLTKGLNWITVVFFWMNYYLAASMYHHHGHQRKRVPRSTLLRRHVISPSWVGIYVDGGGDEWTRLQEFSAIGYKNVHSCWLYLASFLEVELTFSLSRASSFFWFPFTCWHFLGECWCHCNKYATLYSFLVRFLLRPFFIGHSHHIT